MRGPEFAPRRFKRYIFYVSSSLQSELHVCRAGPDFARAKRCSLSYTYVISSEMQRCSTQRSLINTHRLSIGLHIRPASRTVAMPAAISRAILDMSALAVLPFLRATLVLLTTAQRSAHEHLLPVSSSV